MVDESRLGSDPPRPCFPRPDGTIPNPRFSVPNPELSILNPPAPSVGGQAAVRNILEPDFFVHRRYDPKEILPWDFIDHSVSKQYLLAEWRKALLGLQTQPCDVTTCHKCEAC